MWRKGEVDVGVTVNNLYHLKKIKFCSLYKKIYQQNKVLNLRKEKQPKL